MTLWNLIRDFFVQQIFGGTLSNNQVITLNKIGYLYDSNFDAVDGNTSDLFFSIPGSIETDVELRAVYIGLGDWLSTTFTIITLVLLVIFLYIFVKWIFKLFSGLLK